MREVLKVLISAVILVAVSEAGKRWSWLAAIMASLPLTSILAMLWLYWDTGDSAKVGQLSTAILWAIIPSLLFFVALPVLLRWGLRFSWAMVFSCALMFGGYALFSVAIAKLGIQGS